MKPTAIPVATVVSAFLFVSLSGAVSAQTAAAPDPATQAAPTELPSFSVLDEHSATVSSERFRGKVTLFDFWATWCMPCQFTLPELEALHQRFDGQGGFSVAGIAIDSGMGGGVRARRFAKRLGVTYPIYHDFGADSARAAFAVRTVPQMFLVDGDGAVLRHWVGEPDFSEVIAEVEKAVGAGAEAATEAAAGDAAAGGR